MALTTILSDNIWGYVVETWMVKQSEEFWNNTKLTTTDFTTSNRKWMWDDVGHMGQRDPIGIVLLGRRPKPRLPRSCAIGPVFCVSWPRLTHFHQLIRQGLTLFFLITRPYWMLTKYLNRGRGPPRRTQEHHQNASMRNVGKMNQI